MYIVKERNTQFACAHCDVCSSLLRAHRLFQSDDNGGRRQSLACCTICRRLEAAVREAHSVSIDKCVCDQRSTSAIPYHSVLDVCVSVCASSAATALLTAYDSVYRLMFVHIRLYSVCIDFILKLATIRIHFSISSVVVVFGHENHIAPVQYKATSAAARAETEKKEKKRGETRTEAAEIK